jgi:hypothetical protein
MNKSDMALASLHPPLLILYCRASTSPADTMYRLLDTISDENEHVLFGDLNGK